MSHRCAIRILYNAMEGTLHLHVFVSPHFTKACDITSSTSGWEKFIKPILWLAIEYFVKNVGSSYVIGIKTIFLRHVFDGLH